MHYTYLSAPRPILYSPVLNPVRNQWLGRLVIFPPDSQMQCAILFLPRNFRVQTFQFMPLKSTNAFLVVPKNDSSPFFMAMSKRWVLRFFSVQFPIFTGKGNYSLKVPKLPLYRVCWDCRSRRLLKTRSFSTCLGHLFVDLRVSTDGQISYWRWQLLRVMFFPL